MVIPSIAYAFAATAAIAIVMVIPFTSLASACAGAAIATAILSAPPAAVGPFPMDTTTATLVASTNSFFKVAHTASFACRR